MSYVVGDNTLSERTSDQVNAELDNIELRLTQLDGVGLTDVTQAIVNKLSVRIEAVRNQMIQATLSLESQMNSLQAQLTALNTLVTEKFSS